MLPDVAARKALRPIQQRDDNIMMSTSRTLPEMVGWVRQEGWR